MGSFLVKVRFLLGLAWLMGMVEPWKSMVGGCQWEVPAQFLFPSPWAASLPLGPREEQGFVCVLTPPTTQRGRRLKPPRLCIMLFYNIQSNVLPSAFPAGPGLPV